MAKKLLTPTQSYETAFETLSTRKLVDWIWKTRIQNTLGKARQRAKKARQWNASLAEKGRKTKERHIQTKAVVTIIDRRGPKLRPRDNKVRNLVVERMIEAPYNFTTSFSWKDGKNRVKATISPLSRMRKVHN